MQRTVFYCLLTTLAATYVNCAKTNVDTRKDAPDPKMDHGMKDQGVELTADYDLMGAMKDCNETFRIEMSYLEALNESGSFPDETDKTPKCYLRCVLENLKIASPEGDFDPERTAMIFAGERNGTPMDGVQEIASLCAERRETCKCERSYNYLKCIFSMEIEKYEMNS